MYGPNPDATAPLPGNPDIAFLKDVINRPNISMGAYTFVEGATDADSFLKNVLNHGPESPEQLHIGKFCSIAAGVRFVLSGTAHRADWISAYPFRLFGGEWAGQPADYPLLTQHIEVGNDVSIGYEAVIMPGVKIGDGAIINTRAVVTKDIAPYSVVGGNPAHVLRMRFPEYIVERLLEIKWWNWSAEKITRSLPIICSGNIQRLLEEAAQ